MTNTIADLTSQNGGLLKLGIPKTTQVVSCCYHGGFHKCGFIMENHLQKDDLGVPPFQETSIWKPIVLVSV